MYISILVLQKEKKTNFQEVEEISTFSNNLSLMGQMEVDDLTGASEEDLKNLQTRNFIHLSILRSTAWKSLFPLIYKK